MNMFTTVSSLPLFLAILAFLLFGYISLVRIIYKYAFKATPHVDANPLFNRLFFNQIGKGNLFISLPAASFLLFWGWGAALLWLVIFHLLTESIINQQLSHWSISLSKTQKNSINNFQPFQLLNTSPASNTKEQFLISLIWHIFLILILAISISLTVTLINRQSGLVFLLASLIIAQKIFRPSNPLVSYSYKTILAIATIFLGLLLTHHLGLSVFGSINLAPWPWLELNNNTFLIFGFILIGVIQSKKIQLSEDFEALSGICVYLLFLIVLFKLFLLNAPLDTPHNSLQFRDATLPSFFTVSFICFAGLSAVLLTRHYQYLDNAKSFFINAQFSSLFHLLFIIIALISLSCAFGIGSWKTHFTDWSQGPDLDKYFGLLIINFKALLNSNSQQSEISTTLFHAALLVLAFSYLIRLFNILLPDPLSKAKQPKSLFKLSLHQRLPHLIAAFIVSSLLVYQGIHIQLWFVVGILAWFLVSNGLISMNLKQLGRRTTNNPLQYANTLFCFIFIALGAAQVLYLAISWGLNKHWYSCAASAIVLLIALIVWLEPINKLLKSISNSGKSNLISRYSNNKMTEKRYK